MADEIINQEGVELLPLEAPEDTPEQVLTRDLLPRLDEDDERDLAYRILSDHQMAIDERQEWEAWITEDDEQYHGILPDKTFPWPGCSNLHVPITMTGIETLKPRLVESVLGGEPMVLAIPTEATDEDLRDRTELFLNWQLDAEIDIRPKVTASAHLFLLPGTVVIKTLWREELRKRKMIYRFPPETPMEEVLDEVFGGRYTPEDFTKNSDGVYEGEIKEPGRVPRKVKATFDVQPDQMQVLVEREDYTYCAPDPEVLDPLDFVAPSRGGQDIQKLPWCHQILHLNEQKLRRMVQAGLLYEDRVKELLGDTLSGEAETDDPTGVKDTRDTVEGVDAGESDVRNDDYTVIESYRSWDVDEDGWDEEIIVWVSPDLGDKILGWNYLDNICHHGRRPFRRGAYLDEPFKFYGVSFPRMVRGLQDEINTIHNQRVDQGTIQNGLNFVYRGSSAMAAGPLRLKLGEGFPVDNPATDFKEISWSGNIQWGVNEESLLYQYFERLTGVTDLALGRQPNRVGATRTATGVSSLLSEAGLRFKSCMLAFQRLWAGVFEDILALDQQYLPPGKEFRVTGRTPEVIRLTSKRDIAGKFDLRLSASTETLNRQVMREDAGAKLASAANPVLIQTGIIGKKGLYRLARNYFRAYGETDPDLILEPMQDQIVYTPEQELQIWVSGGDVKPTMMENVQQHMEAHMAQMQDPTVHQVLGPAGMAKIMKHLAATQQMAMMQAMAMQMSQQRNRAGEATGGQLQAGEQAMNAQTGKQAPQPGMQPGAVGMGAAAA